MTIFWALLAIFVGIVLFLLLIALPLLFFILRFLDFWLWWDDAVEVPPIYAETRERYLERAMEYSPYARYRRGTAPKLGNGT